MRRRFFKKTIFSIGTLSIIIISLTTNLHAQEIKIRVIKQGAVLKLKPNEESPTIKKLPMGALLDSLETIGEWIKIKLPPDKDGIVIIGYVHKNFVEFEIIPTQIKPKIKPILIEPSHKLPTKKVDDEFLSWRNKLALAKAKKRTGEAIEIFGGLGSLIALGLHIHKNQKGEPYDPWPYRITGLTCSVIAIAGLIISGPAKEEIRILELEGARKGYIQASLIPIKEGFAFHLTFSF